MAVTMKLKKDFKPKCYADYLYTKWAAFTSSSVIALVLTIVFSILASVLPMLTGLWIALAVICGLSTPLLILAAKVTGWAQSAAAAIKKAGKCTVVVEAKPTIETKNT